MADNARLNFGLGRDVALLGASGVGMSALGQFLVASGFRVAGYDRERNDYARLLEEAGVNMSYDLEAFDFPPETQDVIYTPALSAGHPLLEAARKRGLNLYKRSEILGRIAEEYYVVAVAGAHGKTTISTMIAFLLNRCGIKCSALLGGMSVDFKNNFLKGGANILVVEADEYDRSFLRLKPDLLVVTSTDPDHLDVYGDHAGLIAAYRLLLAQVKPGGTVFAHAQINELDFAQTGVRTVRYGGVHTEVSFEQTNSRGLSSRFTYADKSGQPLYLEMHVPGRHNAENMSIAVAVCRELGAKDDALRAAVAEYQGVRRRFEVVFDRGGLALIDDYAHHPAEIAAALASARRLLPEYQLIAAFQPHLYSRTRDFAAQFGQALSGADVVFLTNIYPAREAPLEGVSCENILVEMARPNHKYVVNLDMLVKEISNRIEKPAAILTLGAGDIYKILPGLKKMLAAFPA